jgi:hypothetical protein
LGRLPCRVQHVAQADSVTLAHIEPAQLSTLPRESTG